MMDLESNRNVMTSKHSDEWRLAMARLLSCDEDSSNNELQEHAITEHQKESTHAKELKQAKEHLADVRNTRMSAIFMLDQSRGKHIKVSQKDYIMLELADSLKKLLRKQDTMSLFPKKGR